MQTNQVNTLLVGANPGVRLFDGDRVAAFASIWRVDWSTHGAGAALVLWHDGTVRVLTTDLALGQWLERDFTRHFPEADGLAWPEPEPEECAVEIEIDLDRGLLARAREVEVTMDGVLDRRPFHTDDFTLDAVPHHLQLVIAPMRSATIEVAGRRVAGQVRVDGTPERPSSSAFIAVAEVWSQSPTRS